MRVSSLRSLLSRAQRDSFLGSDGTTLATDLQADIAGLKSILSEIQAATDPQDLSTALSDAYSTYRTYDFVVPVVGLVITIDQIDNVTIPALDQFVTTVQGELGSSNQGVLEPLLADLQAQLTSATTDTSGLSAELLSYTASDWNGNHGLLWPATKDVREADQAISAAQRDENEINQYLSCRSNNNNGGGNNGGGPGNGGPGGRGHGHGGRGGYWQRGGPGGGSGNNGGCCSPTGYGKGGHGGRGSFWGDGGKGKGGRGAPSCGNGDNGGGPGRGYGYPTTTTVPTTTTSTTTTTVPTTTTTSTTTTTTSTTTTTTTVPTTTTTTS
jgi:hypothetical protein